MILDGSWSVVFRRRLLPAPISLQCPSPNDNVPNPFASQYQRQRDIVTWTVAGNCLLLFGGSLVTLLWPRPSAPRSEVTVVRAFRISALRIGAGVMGLLGSFATLSAVLTLAGGAVALATMRDAQTARDITRGTRRACSRPLQSARLAVAAIVCGVFEVMCFIVIDASVVPRVLQVDASCETYSDSNCALYFSEGFARDM